MAPRCGIGVAERVVRCRGFHRTAGAVGQHRRMAQSGADDSTPYSLDRFLDDLRRVGTRVTGGPVWDEEDGDWDPGPVVWQVDVHRGRPLDPPATLVLDASAFADALTRDAAVVERWWPGGDPLSRAYDTLRVSFDAALVGIDRTPHGFVLDRDDTLRLTTQHPCPAPVAHLDADADVFFWAAYEPGTTEFEEQMPRETGRSRHRRHAGLVRAWLLAEAAMDDVPLDATVTYLQDQVTEAFGDSRVIVRFNEYLRRYDVTESDYRTIAGDDERLDTLLDALAGEENGAS